MPELPEVETVVRGLNRLILKKKISKVKHDWPKSFPNAPKDVEDFMVGAEISKVSRRGKAIILKLNNEYTLVTHLRMTGQMVYRGEENWGAGHPNEDFLNDLPNKSTRVEIDFEDGTKLFFNDQRKFGYMKLLPDFEVELLPFFQNLGPEPLENNFTVEVLERQLSRKRKSMVKPAILDQSVVAGVGNIYADEALWAARIAGARPGSSLSKAKLKLLLQSTGEVMQRALAQGGTSFDALYVNTEGESGYFARSLEVYGREGQACSRCGRLLRKEVIGGRSHVRCPNCQRNKQG